MESIERDEKEALFSGVNVENTLHPTIHPCKSTCLASQALVMRMENTGNIPEPVMNPCLKMENTGSIPQPVMNLCLNTQTFPDPQDDARAQTFE